MTIYSRFNIVVGSTETTILSLTNEAADEAIAKLTDGMSAEAIEEKLASLEWDSFEHDGAIGLVVYLD